MAVTARMYVQSITHHAHAPGAGQAKLSVVSRGPENRTWASATPSGTVDLTIGNPTALEWFKARLGREVAISFEDRPHVCPKCQQEVDEAASTPYAQQGETWWTREDGVIEHRTCPA